MTGPSPVERLAAALDAVSVTVPAPVQAALIALVDRMLVQRQNLTAITGMNEAIDRHLVDSLVALRLPEIAMATGIVDVGSGGGFPGIALAAALPSVEVTLVESERKKAQWLERCAADFPNLTVVADRSEHVAATRRDAWPLATARALASPPAALELTAPLVRVGGHVVLWRGSDADPRLDADADAAARILGLRRLEPVPVTPFAGARRILDRYAKVEPTPAAYPRRPGRATKRPLAAPR